MKKIFLIIQREYLSRVRKKSFLILTFLVPSLFIAMYAVIYFIYKSEDHTAKSFYVLDETGIFAAEFKDQAAIDFSNIDGSYREQKARLSKSDHYLLYIPKDYEKGGEIEIISQKKPGLSIVREVESQMEHILQNKRLLDAGIDTSFIRSSKPQISLSARQVTEEGEKDANLAATYIIGFVTAFLVYLSLFIYGAQVMRGIIEEKTSRVVEVIISSVKPFQLMMGKIIGIGAVGLTQFLLWIVLSSGVSVIAGKVLLKDAPIATEKTMQVKAPDQADAAQNSMQQAPAQRFFKAAAEIDFPFIIGTFIFYFLGGYLIYSALFAAVGSAVDNETETQQFMLPITLPLIFTFIVGMNIIVNNPDGSLAFWLSVIPFTSPIAMMIRVPFGVPEWQLYLSMAMLIAGFVFTTWVASRIYRVGILMYGKKVSYKELLKWFRYKE